MTVPLDWTTSSYATHFHILTDVMLTHRPRRILETGSGLYSTPFFLAFDIDKLVSLENDRKWLKNHEDPRHEVRFVDGEVAENLPDLSEFDLIFVDDDPVEGRLKTLFAVLETAPSLVAIHDTNDPRIHQIVKHLPNHNDTAHPPDTSVVCPAATKEFIEWLATR
jgi:hypothetical protein